jgi:hypothetical protein
VLLNYLRVGDTRLLMRPRKSSRRRSEDLPKKFPQKFLGAEFMPEILEVSRRPEFLLEILGG